MKTALVAGASGLVGSELLNLLLQDEGYIKVDIVTRKPITATHPKLVQHVVDFDNLSSSENIFENVDEVFCCLGTTMKKAGSKEAFRRVDFTYPVELAKLAQKKHVLHFLIITAMGANINSSVFYNRVKGEVEETIGRMKFKAITFFHPSLLVGDRKENRTGERIGIFLARLLDFLFIGPLKNYKAIPVSKVARAMLKEARSNPTGVSVILSGEMQGL